MTPTTETLSLHAGDILVVTMPPQEYGGSRMDAYEFVKGLHGVFPEGTQALVLPHGMTVAAMNEDEMRHAGWVRV